MFFLIKEHLKPWSEKEFSVKINADLAKKNRRSAINTTAVIFLDQINLLGSFYNFVDRNVF